MGFMDDFDPRQMTWKETLALLQIFFGGKVRFLFACEDIVFKNSDSPPQGKAAKAEIRRELMETFDMDVFSAKRAMEEAIEHREVRYSAYEIIESMLEDEQPEEEIIERVMNECGFTETYAIFTLFVLRQSLPKKDSD